MTEFTTEKNRKSTILIVDDELDMRLFMSALFETSGYAPVTARDGRQGLAKARQKRPDLIVLDVMMPGEGGALMYKELKSDPKLCTVPVIMLSAVNEISFRHYLTMLNSQLSDPLPEPQAYMEKPPEPEALLELARSVLHGTS